jgi:anti-anti-sigma regulatory factor/PAS domain-containing protein
MIDYLVLPVIVLLSVLLTYVLAQDPRAIANQLFALYAGEALLQTGLNLISSTTVNERLAYISLLPLGPLLCVNQLLLVWLVLALFLPKRYAQPATRWLISLPYLLALAVTLLDIVAGQHLWFEGVLRQATGTFILDTPTEFSPLLGALIIAQLVPIVMLAVIAVRHPERRTPAVVLFSGVLFSFLVAFAPQSRDLPVLYSLGPLPIYLAFAWVTVRYQLFRPSVIVMQTAIESLPDGIVFLDSQRQVRYANRAAHALLAVDQPLTSQPLAAVLEQAGLHMEQPAQETTRQRFRFIRTQLPEQVIEGTEVAVVGDHSAARILVLHDATDREQVAALRTQNEEQSRLLELIATLEIPAVALADNVLLVPIVGHLDSRRAKTLTARLLEQVYQRRARLVVLDITGVQEVDTMVAKALLQTVQALRLLGCQVTLSGVSASTAMTLVHQGVALEGVRTVRSPQEALSLEYPVSGANGGSAIK